MSREIHQLFLKNLKIALAKMLRVTRSNNSLTFYRNSKQKTTKLLITTFLLDRENVEEISNKSNSISSSYLIRR